MKTKKIYTKLKREKKESVEKFLERVIYTKEPGDFSVFKAVETYTDKKCTKKQCAAGKSRSLKDLYGIILSKFPNTSYKTFSKAVIAVMPRTSKALLLCPHVDGEWVLNNYPTIGSEKYGDLGKIIASYRYGWRKLHLSKTPGFDAATLLLNAGFKEEDFPADQTRNINHLLVTEL